MKLEIYNSFAGEIPIIYVSDSDDFEKLVTNIVHKGIRPDNISSTGASFIPGSGNGLVVYTKDLPDSVKRAVSELATIASNNLEQWSKTKEFGELSIGDRIKSMSYLGLEGLLKMDF